MHQSNADPVVVVPQTFVMPQSVAIPYAVPARAAPLRAQRRDRHGGHGPAIAAISRQYKIDPLLLNAIVAKESAFRPQAVSPKGALGLMQVMPGTARGLGVAEPDRLLTDPVLNLATGASYLKSLQRQFGNNLPAVLAAYNAGPGAVRRYGSIPPYAETRDYVATIMARYETARRSGR